MRNALLGIGALLAMAGTQQGAVPPQCWSNGVAVPCAPPLTSPPAPAGYSAAPTPTQYPPSWYYDPYDAPQFHCRSFSCGNE